MIQKLPSAVHVADCLLVTAKLYYQAQLDQLQLNKACYLVNGFTLQERDEPAFYDAVEAWRYGPVIPEVYSAFRAYGDMRITHLETCRTSLDDTDAVRRRYGELTELVGDEVAAIISGVLKEYVKYSGWQLVKMTHGDNTPWKKAYKRGRNNIISTDIIREFYRSLKPDDVGR